MSERDDDGKDQGEDSPKQACSCWFARHSWLATSGANLYPPGVFVRRFDTDMMQGTCVLYCLSLAFLFFIFLLFCVFFFFSFSYFCFHWIRGPSFNRPIIFFLYRFFSSFVHHCCFLFIWRVRRTFSFQMVFFYLLTTGWIFFTSAYYVRIQPILSKLTSSAVLSENRKETQPNTIYHFYLDVCI